MKIINKITPIEDDFAKWYVDVVTNGNLIDYGPVKGTILFKPNAYGIWENIQKEFNKIINKLNVKNVYLPMLIPSSLIKKEETHLKGFAPELATITKVGQKQLNEDIYIRPTSEVMFAQLFKSEIDSHNDLPKLFNQWANVLRWEKTTNPFLRTSEFLWQEGHTSHSTPNEAKELSLEMINIYKNFVNEYLALPVIIGQKTESEKFAGAEITYTIEAMMKDGKALQSGTSHYLGQNFSKMFDISFKNKENIFENVYQTSWGISTRLIGAIIMSHGDNRGIIIPPKIAPIQVDIIELFANKNPKIAQLSQKLKILLEAKKIRVRIDNSNKTPGFKAAQSEIEGVPLRIEIGPRDIENNNLLVISRDTLMKETVSIDNVLEVVDAKLKEIQNNLFHKAQKRLEENIVFVNSYEEFKKQIENKKFVVIPLIDNVEFELKIKEETTATARCIPFSIDLPLEGNCIFTNQITKRFVIFAKAY